MSEIEGVFKTGFSSWLFREDYNWAKGSHQGAGSDREIAVVREYLLGDIANVRLSARNANAAISMVQIVLDTAIAVRDKLVAMQQLAEEAASGHYTDKDKTSMQRQLEELANDISRIVDNTEYAGNKLFTAGGQTISQRIGKDRTIHLFAKDLSFDTEGVDLVADAKQAASTIEVAMRQAVEHTDYITSQSKFLERAMADIEREMASAAGVALSNFETEVTQQFVAYLSAQVADSPRAAHQSQSNMTSAEVLRLLSV